VFEIIGPPEVRDIDPIARYFAPHQRVTWYRKAADQGLAAAQNRDMVAAMMTPQ
jgi:TPR repeat protein